MSQASLVNCIEVPVVISYTSMAVAIAKKLFFPSSNRAARRQSLVEGFSESKTELLDKAGRLALLLGLDEFKANEINLDVRPSREPSARTAQLTPGRIEVFRM